MTRLKLVRTTEFCRGTYGVLHIDNEPIAVTLEPLWQNNERNISCIPPGVYDVHRVDSPNFGETYEVMNVPNRSDILFHWGNTKDDTEGCILVGTSYGPFKDTHGIWNSRGAFQTFLHAMRGLPAPISLAVVDTIHNTP